LSATHNYLIKNEKRYKNLNMRTAERETLWVDEICRPEMHANLKQCHVNVELSK